MLGADQPCAQSMPPPAGSEVINASPTLRHKPATKVSLGQFLIELEDTTLAQVLAAVATGRIDHQGDAGESVYWLCYSVPRTPLPERLWITAHAMGGPEHRIGGVVVQQVNGAPGVGRDCPDLPPAFQRISVDRGIRVGTALSELRRTLGPPSGHRDDWFVFLYSGKVAGRLRAPGDTVERTVEFDESSVLEARIVSRKVVALRASKLTSY
jgi:hypothetical protein